MGLPFLMEARLTLHIATAQWRPLVTKFGYCIGFIIVVLGRLQVFTENTLTPILQLLHRKDRQTLAAVARLWAIVLGSDLMGAAIFALLMHAMVSVKADQGGELTSIGLKIYQSPFAATLPSAVFTGWLIAHMVWLLPVAESGRVTIIILFTYILGLSGFAHIIAGSVNAFFIRMEGGATLSGFITRFCIPTLLGNITRGVAFVAAINTPRQVLRMKIRVTPCLPAMQRPSGDIGALGNFTIALRAEQFQKCAFSLVIRLLGRQCDPTVFTDTGCIRTLHFQPQAVFFCSR